jgi:hypothetical protein
METTCHHCGRPIGSSPYALVLQGLFEDHRLPLCESCQDLRRNGQLPTEMLVQQWVYARSAVRAEESGEVEGVLVQLDCLGCGSVFSRFALPTAAQPAPGLGNMGQAGAAQAASRLPDGSLSAVCPECQRTNVLERRGSQLVAVRLW